MADPARRARIAPTLAILSVVALRGLHADQPIVENYVGRQIPTAMAARNFLRGTPFLRPLLDTEPHPNLFLVEPPIYAWTAAKLGAVGFSTLEARGRWLSAMAMGLAAWGLHGLARRREGDAVALVAVLAFGLFPATVRYGRAFQPDALMLGLIVAGMRLWDDHEAQGGRARLALAWLLVAAGLAVKIVSAYALIPLVIAILRPPRVGKVALAFSTLIPAALWYVHAAGLLGQGSRASADNAALWGHALGFSALLRPETWAISARFLFGRSFTPLGFSLAMCGLFVLKGADRLWRVWLAAAAAAFAILAGKIHHEYYWMALAPILAVGVGRAVVAPTIRPIAQGAILAAFAALGLFQSASTWRTPGEWSALPRAVEAVRRQIDPRIPGSSILVAPEAILYASDRRGFRLEVEPSARVRASGEFGATISPSDPLALVEFYRSRGALYVVDLRPSAGEPHRRALHDAIRGRYNVIVDRDGVILAELVAKPTR